MATFYRDTHGRFLQKGYSGAAFLYVDGTRIEVNVNNYKGERTRKSQAAYNLGIKEHEPHTATENIVRRGTKIPDYTTHYEEKGKSNEEEFVFDYNVYKKRGYNRQVQEAYYKIFKEANRLGTEINLASQGTINPKFSYNLDIPKEQLERRLKSAMKIIETPKYDYIEEKYSEYKSQYLGNIRSYISDSYQVINKNGRLQLLSSQEYKKALQETYPERGKYALKSAFDLGMPATYTDKKGNVYQTEKLKNVFEDNVLNMDNKEFYKLMRKLGLEKVAFGLDSIIDEGNYNIILADVFEIARVTNNA